jgi:hypothetical protein
VSRGHSYTDLLLELALSVKRRSLLATNWGSSIEGGPLMVRIQKIVMIGSDEDGAPCSFFLEPQERTDTMLCFKFHLKAAAGHNSRIAAPAGFMIQIHTVHVKAGADLFDFPFVARQLIVE